MVKHNENERIDEKKTIQKKLASCNRKLFDEDVPFFNSPSNTKSKEEEESIKIPERKSTIHKNLIFFSSKIKEKSSSSQKKLLKRNSTPKRNSTILKSRSMAELSSYCSFSNENKNEQCRSLEELNK